MLTRAVVRSQAVRNSGASVEGYVKQTPSEKLNTQARADYARANSRLRVLTLYKAFYRAAPEILVLNKSSIPVNVYRQVIKNEFAKNSNISDTRAIELLLGKGQMDFQELVVGYSQESQMHRPFDELLQNDPKATDFVSKFLNSKF
ncbi:Oidioi.mRNA.OKI2018_I69.XSR.g13727.t1.cds [Oikopleura dioica]|uniref:NADH dehydrogenase [ubiquinone] 1 alpha subcomplex subunit 6 n=1 Tax=Oikopleura dioica TaxID=34765 RepID=A0ABN7S7Q6_OIKDI|nr:Oidioi.mRNA.OKI2018_I69.XSR.g13727.t1.cds [Oikopleura dioica]